MTPNPLKSKDQPSVVNIEYVTKELSQKLQNFNVTNFLDRNFLFFFLIDR